MKNSNQIKKILLIAVKIAIGSSAAIYTAQCLQLEYAVSAGTITLLTLMVTKWEAIKLSGLRLMTFAATVLIAWAAFAHIDSTWFAYGIFIFLMVFLCERMGLGATISVNAVIGAHLLTSHDFTIASIRNEFLLVIIGIGIALILNLFQNNRSREKEIIAAMRYTEKQLQSIICSLAAYLLNPDEPQDVWASIYSLEEELHGFLQEAYEYQGNTFQSHPGYYIDYFDMRQSQCHLLYGLHDEIKKIRDMPKQAKIIAEYMLYLKDYVIEVNEPFVQLDQLHAIIEAMANEELPKTRGEFESRALLYHILMDIEEFLQYKSRFVKGLDARQLQKYWDRNKPAGKNLQKNNQ